MVCKDGGDVFHCTSCPRACHGPCSGHTPSELNAMMYVLPSLSYCLPLTMVTRSYYCSQHSCSICSRSTQEAGGLLFRCQRCPQAFCEDCLPSDDIEAVGDVLPEFLVLGMGKRSQAYFMFVPLRPSPRLPLTHLSIVAVQIASRRTRQTQNSSLTGTRRTATPRRTCRSLVSRCEGRGACNSLPRCAIHTIYYHSR